MISKVELQTDFDANRLALQIFLCEKVVTSPDQELFLFPAKPREFNVSLYDMFFDPKVTQFLTISPDFNAEKYIIEMNGRIGQPSRRQHILFHIYTNRSHGPIGHITIKDIDWNNLSFHRGIVLKEEYMGKGIGSKVSYMILEHMKRYGFKKAYTCVHAKNVRSLKNVRKHFDHEEQEKDGYIKFSLDLTKELTGNPFSCE